MFVTMDGFDMNLSDRILVVMAALALIVSVIVLGISEDARSIYKVANLSLVKEVVDLKKINGGSGYVGFAKIENVGGAASEKLKLIFSFEGVVPKYEVTSDEDVGNITVKDKDLRVSMDRLSSSANLKVSMQSIAPISYVVKYVDDGGAGDVVSSVAGSTINILNVVFLIVIFGSLLVLVRIFRRASESNLISLLTAHQNSIQDGFREIRDEIGNIEVVVNDIGEGSGSASLAKTRGVTQRLSELMSKIP